MTRRIQNLLEDRDGEARGGVLGGLPSKSCFRLRCGEEALLVGRRAAHPLLSLVGAVLSLVSRPSLSPSLSLRFAIYTCSPSSLASPRRSRRIPLLRNHHQEPKRRTTTHSSAKAPRRCARAWSSSWRGGRGDPRRAAAGAEYLPPNATNYTLVPTVPSQFNSVRSPSSLHRHVSDASSPVRSSSSTGGQSLILVVWLRHGKRLTSSSGMPS